MIKIFILAVLASVASKANEVGPSQNQQQYGKRVAEPGKPIRWVFPNGNELVAVSNLEAPKAVSTRLTMTKNTCNQAPAPKCSIKTQLQKRVFSRVWIKHSDPAMVGKTLELRKSNPDEMYERYETTYVITQMAQWIWARRELKDVSTTALQESLVCDNFDWMPKNNDGSSSFQSWLTMFESGTKEIVIGDQKEKSVNQYISSIYNGTLKPISSQEYGLAEARTVGVDFDFGFLSPALGYQTIFNFDRSAYGIAPQPSQGKAEWSDPQCRIEFTINFQDIFTNYMTLIREKPQTKLKNQRVILFDMKDPAVRNNSSDFFRSGIGDTYD